MIKPPEIKVAQEFVILAYKRYRLTRRWHNDIKKMEEYKFRDTSDKYIIENERYAAHIEANNHLQLAKKIYYDLINKNNI